MPTKLRPYRQVARAASTEDLRRRILDAFRAAMRDEWMDDIALDRVAKAAGTTRQTVIRLFGGKEGLIEALALRERSAVELRRATPKPATPETAVEAILVDYEALGDLVCRLLAQEDRHPALRVWHDIGRAFHRNWVVEIFADALPPGEVAREALVTELVVALDLYVWKLLRRDFHFSVEKTRALMTDMVRKILEG
ncbi:TetR family transcriptional regulator [Roseiarcus fermentans]|uniref:TetR family transcriptional regulator n=1 Tax=Roseiarcus fermentans TaxID=1473586 RepID=A0A366EXF2_9HYPH|nr:TetR/AcrR family transcriptional regulator [Roseiarcus fermentans]RBP07082.1 TetR family transcriptional regulator [Roseiarcus fermentans]